MFKHIVAIIAVSTILVGCGKPAESMTVKGAAYQRQQAREVVMPKRRSVDPYAYDQGANNRADGWNACLDEFARLNKGVGSHE